MSYFIVIHGTLGSGKSTISNELAIKLNADRVQIDYVLSEHKLDLHEDNEASIPAANFIKGLDFVLSDVREKLDHEKIVIFDGCFYHKEVMDYLLKNLPYPYFLFTLKAPLEICIERDKNRSVTLGEDAARAVYSLTSGLDFGEIIDTVKPLEESINKILEIIENNKNFPQKMTL